MTPESLVFLGVFLGVLCRLLLPWLRKLREDPSLKFDPRYLVSFGASLAIAFIATVLALPSADLAQLAQGNPLIVFSSSFAVGWASEDLLNECLATGKHQP